MPCWRCSTGARRPRGTPVDRTSALQQAAAAAGVLASELVAHEILPQRLVARRGVDELDADFPGEDEMDAEDDDPYAYESGWWD